MKKITIILMALIGASTFAQNTMKRIGGPVEDRVCACPGIEWNFKTLNTTTYVDVEPYTYKIYTQTEQCTGNTVTSQTITFTNNTGGCFDDNIVGANTWYPISSSYDHCVSPRINLSEKSICKPGNINYTSTILRDEYYYIGDTPYRDVCIEYSADYSVINPENKRSTLCSEKKVFSYRLKSVPQTNACLIQNGWTSRMWVLDGSADCSNANAQQQYKSNNQLSESNTINYLSIFPNPANDELNIENLPEGIDMGSVITIYSVDGRLLLNKIIVDNSPQKLNISSLAPGTYMISITINGNTADKRIFIKAQ